MPWFQYLMSMAWRRNLESRILGCNSDADDLICHCIWYSFSSCYLIQYYFVTCLSGKWNPLASPECTSLYNCYCSQLKWTLLHYTEMLWKEVHCFELTGLLSAFDGSVLQCSALNFPVLKYIALKLTALHWTALF